MGYVFLFSAIIFEIIATTLLKVSDGFARAIPSVGCVACYVACYFLFGKSIQSIPLGIAYASWCGIGIIATSVISVMAFHDSLSMVQLVGLAIIIVGCVLVNFES